jgi:transcriptional regulator of arginine metabolism
MAKKKPEGKEINKQERQKRLIDLIANGQFKTQDDIELGFAEQGLKVSQSSISRDIEDLGITKSDEGVYVIDSKLSMERKKEALAALLSTANAESHYPVSFFCVKCDEGYERLLATNIEGAFALEVVGTVVDKGIVIVFTPRDEEDSIARNLSLDIAELVEKA